MQIESMRVISHRSWRVDEVSGADARARLWRLEKFAEMRADGCSEALSLEMIGWSRATYHRWHKRWQYGMRADAPGVLMQFDHMSVSFPGTSVKSFTAVCPTTGYLVAWSSAAPPATTPRASWNMCWTPCRSPSTPSKSTAAASSGPPF